MKLTPTQVARFREDGFLVLPDLFSPREVTVLRAAAQTVFAEESPANVREKLSGEVRTAMGLHLRHDIFARLVRHPRFVEPAMQLLADDRL
jgi:ectoine hydroxylase